MVLDIDLFAWTYQSLGYDANLYMFSSVSYFVCPHFPDLVKDGCCVRRHGALFGRHGVPGTTGN